MSSAQTSSDSNTEKPVINNRAVAMISGGLDSALAIHLVKKQGIEVTALHSTSFFSPLDGTDEDSPVVTTARQLGVELVLQPKGDEFIEIIRNPKHGHGKNINPCIDCRIFTFIKAKKFMEEIGASFIVTGEVVGQRPMSQRKDAIGFIEKRAGCEGIILRPLSAKLLPPTFVEQAGIVDREQLLDVAGRGRKVQLAMAEEIGLTGYSTPAGGCKLTEQVYARRLKDLLDDRDDVSQEDLELLTIGRHLRLRPGLKIVVSRREDENQRISDIEDAGTIFSPIDFPGPLVAIQGTADLEEEMEIAAVLRRYSKEASRGKRIRITSPTAPEREINAEGVAADLWISDRMI